MNISKRQFIRGGLYAGLASFIAKSAFLQSAFAEWPTAAFDETEYEPALKGLIGDEALNEGGVIIDAPEIAGKWCNGTSKDFDRPR